MEHPNENLIYSARFGLKHANHNAEKAAKVAVAKYRSIIKRQLRAHEVAEIRNLIMELQSWCAEQNSPRSLVAVG